MSNEANERLQEFISEEVSRQWQLPNRPDLEKDCVEFIWDRWDKEIPYQDEVYITFLLIQFLSGHCRNALSSQDIDFMAIEEIHRNLERQLEETR